jgi:hypothetical protein
MARVGDVGGTSTTVSIIILLIIMVTTVTTMVGYSATLNPSENVSTSGTCQGIHITSVTGISSNTTETITIRGCGFGSDPQLRNNISADGSVDTVQSNVTPSIAIFKGLSSGGASSSGGSWTWEAGFANTLLGGADTIGINLTSWSDNTIVIHGFGAYLRTNPQGFDLVKGDTITIVIVGPNCAQSTYNFPPFPASCSTQYSTVVGGT